VIPRLVVLVAVLSLAGCTKPEPASPALLGMHMEASGGAGIEPGSGVFAWGADLGVEKAGCCGVGAWGSHTSAPSAKNDEQGTDYRIDGGLETGIVIPAAEDRFRFRLRAGVSTTTKDPPLLGRSGYTAGGTVLFRIADVTKPQAGGAALGFDAIAGYRAWAYGPADSSAGVVAEDSDSHQGQPVTTHALVVGVRLGAEFGLDLQ
jgi:hypothetical protein